nr:hypothetical protein [Tanacetum cinerariifolium]
MIVYTLDGLSLIASKIGTPLMLDSYTCSMCLESWGRSSYARILTEIDARNDLYDIMVIFVRSVEGSGYTKETTRVEYEWKPTCCGTCLVFGHSGDECPKIPKRVVNMVDEGKGGSSGADDDGFVEAKKKRSSGNNRGNKNFNLCNLFDALNDDNMVILEVESVRKCVLVDVDGKPLEMANSLGDHNSYDEVESVDNDIA